MAVNIFLIIIGVLLFNLMIFLHELGHYITARIFKVKVNEFALGMGPRVLKFAKNGTIYSLRAFPIGGFCEMEGEDEEVKSASSFGEKAPWKKIIIITAGAIMNVILGFCMLICLNAGNEKFETTTVKSFRENAISQSSGLHTGDEILSVDGFKTSTLQDLGFALTLSNKINHRDLVSVQVKRAGNKINLENIDFGLATNEGRLDFSVETIPKNFWTLIRESYLKTVSTVKIVWHSLITFIAGKVPFKELSGPIGLANLVGKTTAEGLKTGIATAIVNMVSLMVFITINLGVFNLLPLPALDGGRLIFLLFELITRKKLNPKYEGWVHAVGLFLFIALMVIIAFQDTWRIFFNK